MDNFDMVRNFSSSIWSSKNDIIQGATKNVTLGDFQVDVNTN